MVSSRGAFLATACLLMVGLSGCASFNETVGQGGSFGEGRQVAVSGNGQMSGSDSKTLECSDQAQVAVGFNGQGKIKVSVKDGAGVQVYSKEFNGNGQGGETQDLDGTPGKWTITVTFGTGGLIGGWNGQYGIYLRC